MITQKEVYDLIIDNSPDGCSFWFSDKNLQIIKEELGWKSKSIFTHLRNLRKKGLLRRYTSRTYVLAEKYEEWSNIVV